MAKILWVTLGLLSLDSVGACSGTWTVTTEADWYLGKGRNLDFIVQSGSLRVLRNFSDEFIFSGANQDPLPPYWACQPGYCDYGLTHNSGKMTLYTSSLLSEWFGFTDFCSKIYQPIDGDFIIESSISSGTSPHNFWAAQLFVKASPYTWFFCGSILSSGGYQHAVGVSTNGSSNMVLGTINGGPGKYRITKTGNVLKGSYRTTTTYFIDIASTTINPAVWPHLTAGIYQKDTYYAGSWAAFDYMYFSTTRTAADSCHYLSKVFDLGATPSASGTISWVETVPASASVEVFGRSSGNGSTWSAWTGPYASAGGSTITAPPARYFQFSVTLYENPSMESPAIDSVTIEFPGVPPATPLVGSPSHPGEIWKPESQISFSVSMPGDNPAPVWAYYYAMGVSPVSGTSPSVSAIIVSSTVTGVSVSGFSDGEHLFSLVAMGAPNVYPLSLPGTFHVRRDSIPPEPVTVTSRTHQAAVSSQNNSPIFDMSAADSISVTTVVSGIAGFHYEIDDQAGTIPGVLSPFTTASSVPFTGLKNQTWWFHARAKDAAGNLGGVGHYPVSINFDGVLLTESSVHAVPHPIRTTMARIRYELAAPADSVSGEVFDDAGTRVARLTGAVSVGRNEFVWNNAGLPNGVYYLRMIARRVDGKEDKITKKLALLR